jgi:hypothetical protein
VAALEPLSENERRQVWATAEDLLGPIDVAIKRRNGASKPAKGPRPGQFSADQVRELRRAYREKKLTAPAIVAQTGHSRESVRAMLAGYSYRHVKDEP